VKERNRFEDLGPDGHVLNWIFKTQDYRSWTGFISLRIDSIDVPL
jgi:hypothetical protein